jgi:hypothetical protein
MNQGQLREALKEEQLIEEVTPGFLSSFLDIYRIDL